MDFISWERAAKMRFQSHKWLRFFEKGTVEFTVKITAFALCADHRFGMDRLLSQRVTDEKAETVSQIALNIGHGGVGSHMHPTSPRLFRHQFIECVSADAKAH